MESNELQSGKKSGGKKLLIILLILLLAGSAVSNYMFWDKSSKASKTADSKIDSLRDLSLLKDSLYTQLAEEQQKVANLRAEIMLHLTNSDSLQQLLDAKEAKIASLRAALGGGSPSKLRALKDSIARLKNDNMSFRTQMDSLLMQNEDYRAKLQERENAIAALENQRKILSDKVDIAAQPYVGPVIVTPMYAKKGIYIPIYKAKKVERLQITFDVLGNKLTEKTVSKEYFVRIIDPDGIVLSNNNSKLVDSDEVYTVKEEVTFNGTQQKIKITFTQSPSYKKGKYKVELKEGSELKHNFSFELL